IRHEAYHGACTETRWARILWRPLPRPKRAALVCEVVKDVPDGLRRSFAADSPLNGLELVDPLDPQCDDGRVPHLSNDAAGRARGRSSVVTPVPLRRHRGHRLRLRELRFRTRWDRRSAEIAADEMQERSFDRRVVDELLFREQNAPDRAGHVARRLES